ncbi:hypothetical protein KPH14_000697 [Odynerus spinipes]|uniref:Nucleic-acid-binding protein from transposon X-element n=1 Tax=Odynerus spinipes TaxID=1348599 RepID=A0AAD9VKG7_9HYME|nr:hypothetical protein KPH14_000697 [Odynerus spinipes]
MNTYDKLINILKASAIQFYTYTPRNLKPKSLVLKGIRGGYDETEVLTAITDLNLPNTKIIKVRKLIFNKNSPDKYHFIVSISNDSLAAPLVKVKRLLSQTCRWERLRKPIVFQCRRCQQIGHASSNCFLKPTCSKCAGEHEVVNCPIKDETDKSKQKCVNCNSLGHSAAYKGCPMIKLASKLNKQIKQQKANTNKTVLNTISRKVTPGYSFANALVGNQTHLQAPLHSHAREETTLPINKQYSCSTSNNNCSSSPNIEELFANLKNEIIKEIQDVNAKIINNSIRIDHILAQLNMD